MRAACAKIRDQFPRGLLRDIEKRNACTLQCELFNEGSTDTRATARNHYTLIRQAWITCKFAH